MITASRAAKPLKWIGSSRRDYMAFPQAVQDAFGFELYLAQLGQHPPSAKPLKDLGGGVVELIEAYDGDAYRAVYVARFASAVYVVHAFKKKSKTGVKTPQADIDLIRARLKDADIEHKEGLK